MTFVASLLGAFLAKAVLKKHFEKAGIITGKENRNVA
ncbi:MptD family putative ECF transporter S component [Butyrivibrio sp. XB500-5]|nr:MptD family putative ECF transporter S component [Butyrivibrio sp. XB500-5]